MSGGIGRRESATLGQIPAGGAVRSVPIISQDGRKTHMIEIDGLTKRYGDKAAVDGLSFVVEPGVVTGFLGPNGVGKPVTGL